MDALLKNEQEQTVDYQRKVYANYKFELCPSCQLHENLENMKELDRRRVMQTILKERW